jgi:signal transduction histidine kinase
MGDAQGFDVIGQAPDGVLMNGVEATQVLTDQGIGVPVILHTAYSDDSLVLEGLKAGARGYILKGSAGSDLLGAIRSVVDGNAHVSDEVTGAVVDRLVVALDNERKTRLKAEQAARDLEVINERQREFAKMSQHELRTPLTVLLVAIESLVDSTNASERDELERLALCGGRRLRRLTENLEVAACIQDLTLSNMRTDLRTCIEESIIDLDASDRVVCDVDEGVELLADSLRLQQVFSNLLENALEKSPASKPVEISARQGNDRVTIRVTDHGPGFESVPALGDRTATDRQAPFTLRPNAARGFGLGLWIVDQLVGSMGGRVVAANNTPATGATVTVSLPLASSARMAS